MPNYYGLHACEVYTVTHCNNQFNIIGYSMMALDSFDRDDLECFIQLMAEDLQLVITQHKSKSVLSDRDVDDMQALLLDLKEGK